MQLSEDEIIQILKLIDESGFGEFRMETDTLKLTIIKGGRGSYDKKLSSSTGGITESTKLKESNVADNRGSENLRTCAAPESIATKAGRIKIAEEGNIFIESPMIGTFYRQAKPGAPPFVDVGTFVTEENTVCLIEVMKCFSSIKAKVRGRIIEVCAESGDMVEVGQPLFIVKPEEAGGGST